MGAGLTAAESIALRWIEKLPQAIGEPVHIVQLALPDDEHAPAAAAQCGESAAVPIAFLLRVECQIGALVVGMRPVGVV